MSIQFRCLHCAHLLSIGSRKAGRRTRCPACGRDAPVPAVAPPPPASPPVAWWVGQAPPQPASAPAAPPDLVPLSELAAAAAPAPPPAATSALALPVALGVGLCVVFAVGISVLMSRPARPASPVAPPPEEEPRAQAPPAKPPDEVPVTSLPPRRPTRRVAEKGGEKVEGGRGRPVTEPARPARRRGVAELVSRGFKNARTLAVDDKGRVFVSDSGWLYCLEGDARPSRWLKDGSGAVGLAVDAAGRLLAGHSRTGEVVRLAPPPARPEPLTGGRHFKHPRRLAVDRHGGVYVCDGGAASADADAAVYHVSPRGRITRQETAPARPRALALAPDGKTLYVVSAGSATVLACPIDTAGDLGRPRPYGRVEGTGTTALIDLAVDGSGRVMVLNDTTRSVERFTPTGDRLDRVELPETAVACAAGGPGRRTLYVLTRTALFAIDFD